MLTLDEFPSYLRRQIDGKQSAFAARHGFGDSYVSQVVNGKKQPSRKLLAAVGLQRRVFLVPAIAMEAAKPTRREAGSARKGDSAGLKGIAQSQGETP